ncbi:MAG: hypothetical protein IKT32_00755 [Clostridia bacterium]|nr:hypothetical protein [Clostridia bacterium]
MLTEFRVYFETEIYTGNETIQFGMLEAYKAKCKEYNQTITKIEFLVDGVVIKTKMGG